MTFTDEELNEFIQMWQAEFRESISTEFAGQRAAELIELYVALSQTGGAVPEPDAERP